jgi:DNA-directed RNA polymerase specialized sigma24 family protein
LDGCSGRIGVFPVFRVIAPVDTVYVGRCCVLDSPSSVVRALITYTDWWQPTTASLLKVGRRDRGAGDGIRPGLLDSLDVRAELCRRMRFLTDRDRGLLHLWYLRQLPVEDIAKMLHISRRQCFRRRAAAIRTLADPEGTRVAGAA